MTNSEWDTLEALLGEIVQGQKAKVLNVGRRIVPYLTPEDVLQPNDYPELENHPHFRYEEGVLEGVQTVAMAIAALRKDQLAASS